MKEIKPGKRKKANEDAGKYVLSEIKKFVKKEASPVKNQTNKWQGLEKKYKKWKRGLGKGTRANLHLKGDMLDSVKVKADKKGFELKVTDKLQKKKAYNHNVGDTLPKRQWLPNDEAKQTFKKRILEGLRKRLGKFKDEGED